MDKTEKVFADIERTLDDPAAGDLEKTLSSIGRTIDKREAWQKQRGEQLSLAEAVLHQEEAALDRREEALAEREGRPVDLSNPPGWKLDDLADQIDDLSDEDLAELFSILGDVSVERIRVLLKRFGPGAN